jgi:hypothetical protein
MIGTFAPRTTPARRLATQVFELFGEHIPGLEIGDDKNVRLSGDRRVEFLDKRRGGAARGVKSKGTIENASDNLTAVGHLAERRRVNWLGKGGGPPH